MITLTAANAILTKARCMYGKQLGQEDYNALMSCRSVSEVAYYLKTRTHYSKELSGLDEGTIHRQQLEELLHIKEFEEFASLCRYEFNKKDGFSEYIIMTGEIRQLLHFLRLLAAGRPEEYLFSLPVFFSKHSTVDLYALSRAKSYADFLKVVKKSRYAKAFAPFSDETGFDFTAVEHALYRYMYSYVLDIIFKRSATSERRELEDIFGSLMDMENFLHIYRLKRYYNADESTIKTLLFANNNKLKKDRIEEMISAPDSDSALEIMKTRTPYSKLFNLPGITPDNVYERLKFRLAKKYIHYSVNPSVVMVSYILLSQIELNNLINIIECVRYGLPPEETAGMITV